MAATQTVYQLPHSRNSSNVLPTTQVTEATRLLTPRHGVVTLFGYGIGVRVERGHLIVEDGIGAARREVRFPRVGHGLRRLVVIGADGMVSLAALRWLADQDACFVMLDRRGSVLATTGPVRPSDARLRRAQALADESGSALRIVRELIGQKLAGQERIAREKLCNSRVAETIAKARVAVAKADSIQAIRLLESQAAGAYWSAWHSLPVMFPRSDVRRVPEHWRSFGARRSPLTGSPRLAVNPPNAILNYLYAVLESEARLAAAALGLDPGLGFLHKDMPTRDSLACDLMEPVRPQVDAFVLDWITRECLRREWFFEQRDGNCRLMGSFAVRLSETAAIWARAIAPMAEGVVRTLWATKPKPARQFFPATRLTQGHRREAKDGQVEPPAQSTPRPPAVCRVCGVSIQSGQSYCASCAVTVSKETLIEAAKLGRVAAHTPEARARQAEKQRRHAAEVKAWNSSDKPDWLTEEVYREKIQPRLSGITVPALSSALGLSEPYAAEIRAGRYLPHPRHWQTLARLTLRRGGL
jgi:CRISPR-associated endonuclease Cas1